MTGDAAALGSCSVLGDQAQLRKEGGWGLEEAGHLLSSGKGQGCGNLLRGGAQGVQHVQHSAPARGRSWVYHHWQKAPLLLRRSQSCARPQEFLLVSSRMWAPQPCLLRRTCLFAELAACLLGGRRGGPGLPPLPAGLNARAVFLSACVGVCQAGQRHQGPGGSRSLWRV